jgi:hypothetical protein
MPRTEHYTAEGVRHEVTKDFDRLFAPYTVGRSPNWTPDAATKDLISIGRWLDEELMRLGCNDADRKTQNGLYHRQTRSNSDYADVAADALNAVLDGTVEQNRVPHRRWG